MWYLNEKQYVSSGLYLYLQVLFYEEHLIGDSKAFAE
jgi:hypothetical protein